MIEMLGTVERNHGNPQRRWADETQVKKIAMNQYCHSMRCDLSTNQLRPCTSPK
jgi:hypothetical protein